MLSKWFGRKPKEPTISPQEQEELRRAQQATDTHANEATSLLENAKESGGVLRQSRRENHYIRIIDNMFRGEAHAD